MREFWIKLDKNLSDEKKIHLINSTKDFCTAYLVGVGDETIPKRLGVTTVSPKNGDIHLSQTLPDLLSSNAERTCFLASIRSGKDELPIINAIKSSVDYVILECKDWTIIPLENIIASASGRTKIIASVSNPDEAMLVLEVLEIGADGVFVDLTDVHEIKRIYDASQKVQSRIDEMEEAEKISLRTATITKLKSLRSGARICIDTCDLMKEGEGVLVGCQSSGLFLIQAEIEKNPYISTRPFRVNVGSIAQYILEQGDKTRYLSELRIGDDVLIVDKKGRNRITSVCRTKIEWRPLLMIQAESDGQIITSIVQNAETIRLVTKDGTKSVTDIETGDEIKVFFQKGGRHFGKLVKDERVIER